MTEQRDAGWVESASDEERVRALSAGELVHYMGGQTPDEVAHDKYVQDTPDRLYAEAYGFNSYAQMESAVGANGSTLTSALRKEMTPDQLAKLDWIASATPAEVYAAERAGDLDHLLRRDVPKEQARLAAIGQQVRQGMRDLYA